MHWCFEMDDAFREDRKRRKNEEKIKKLKVLINDKGATEGEKESARLILKKLEEEN